MESQAGLAWKGPPRSFTLCLLSGSTAKTIQNCHLTLTDSRNAFHSSCFAMGMAVGSSGRTREVPNPCEREAESPGSCEGNRIFLGNFEGLAPKGNRGNPGGAGKRCRSVSGIPGKWKAAEAARTELEAGSSRFLSVGLCCWKFEGDQSWSTCGFTCGAWERRWTRNSRDVPLAGVRSSGSTLLSASSLPSPRSPGAPGKICSGKGLLVWTDGVAGRAGNPRAPVAPSSDLPAGSKDHSQVSSPGSVTRTGKTTELAPSLGPRALVLE
ncbi:uncharacterized protein LOC116437077 isoform X2 [Corvus moneduloides]|uniref:uncharacterized protein LOC116437077 isoform X2 n=1 Tax=Corvus moneduloides TaxID=1196302 RepID=UPI0013631136|nr:uncharacterized protein LOC116437077 isoform X2 [Corvus moneduloides]